MLEIPGYTVNEFERLAGLPRNTAYKLMKRGEITAVVDVCGQYRIPYGEAVLFMRTKEDQTTN